MPKTGTLSVSYPASMTDLCRDIFQMPAKDLSEDVVWWLELAVYECVHNALVHGNRKDPAKKVLIEYEWSQEHFRITITDEGDGFDLTAVGDPTIKENITREEGRGVFLMKHVMDSIEYNSSGNSITMTKQF